jgi:uncharacterized protein with von Willebrand factor type A (vWA) domain
MTKLETITQAISELRPDDVRALAEWLAEYQADLWDRQIEADARNGRLDKLAEKAMADHDAGRTIELDFESPQVRRILGDTLGE